MSASARTELLSRWIKPSSENEQVQQERAEDMVRKAITTCNAFDGTNVLIYTKGSYPPNNTNVRRDSDVDVVIELRDCLYYGYKAGVTGAAPPPPPYQGSWTPESWRKAVVDALVVAFGSDSVDTSGRVAINISAVEGSRPSADVVPSFDYRRYDNSDRTISKEGSCVFPTDGGSKIVNWPQQQLDNGRSLNTETNHRYKNYVRALKNAENFLATAAPSTSCLRTSWSAWSTTCLPRLSPLVTSTRVSAPRWSACGVSSNQRRVSAKWSNLIG